jgi:hypothetical protein
MLLREILPDLGFDAIFLFPLFLISIEITQKWSPDYIDHTGTTL